MQQTAESTVLTNSTLSSNATIATKMAQYLVRLPARMLYRMRLLDSVFEQNLVVPSNETGLVTAGGLSNAQQRARDAGLTSLPGPWGFVSSGYFFGLIFMTFLLNRVQNIVVPPRHSASYRRQLRSLERRVGRRPWTRLLRSLLPVNFASTRSRLALRLPSIYLLLKSMLLWTIILLQTAHMYPSYGDRLTQNLETWALQKPMEDVCWSTFKSVCVALFVSALTSGMEGFHTTGNAPFNLFGYAFVLYVYASPMTHVHKGRGTASRPDVHVLITMMLPLLQLTMTHCLEVKQRWGRKRLIPTTICGVLSLVHFHLVVWCFPSSYPLPNIVPNFVESFLLFVTLLTCGLNALTQLLTTGAITKPLVGHAETLRPKWEEDFSVALFRLGTASLEATSVAGLGNEVGSVKQPTGDVVRPPLLSDASSVEITRTGLVSVVHGKHSQPHRGLANEIKNVKVSSGHSGAWADMLVNATLYKELGRFLMSMWRVARGSVRFLWAGLRRRAKCRQLVVHPAVEDHLEPNYAAETPGNDAQPEEEVYERFLRGDDLSEDESDFEPGGSSPGTPSATSDDEAEADDDGDTDLAIEGASDALVLYADLSESTGGSASVPVLLAHMTNPSASPLTRRRYSHMSLGQPAAAASSSQIGDWGAFVRERRDAKLGVPQDDAWVESRRSCVICTVEPRDIICWPCRCLALCDDCRENMASRSAASKHLCPCCRTPVEGFSKIYIP